MHSSGSCEPSGSDVGQFPGRVPSVTFLFARTRVSRVGRLTFMSCDRSSHRLGLVITHHVSVFNVQHTTKIVASVGRCGRKPFSGDTGPARGCDGLIEDGSLSHRYQVSRPPTNNSSNREPLNRVDATRLAREEKLETDEGITRTNAWASVILS